MSQYNSYRIFISEQPSVFTPDAPKEIKFEEIIIAMARFTKTDFYYKRDHHIFFFLSAPAQRIVIFQFGHEKMVRTPKAGLDKITMIEEPQTPFVHFILDLDRQIILIENNTLAFKEIEFVVKRIEAYFEKEMHRITNANYKVLIRAITKEDDFWDIIDESNKIYSLELTFNAPNLFGGRFEASKIVKEAYQETNFEEFKLKLLSSKGLLHIIKDSLSEYIKLIAAGGGKYKVTIRRKGERNARRIDSSNKSIKENLPNDISEISGEELNNRLTKLDNSKSTESIQKVIGPGEQINPPKFSFFTFTPPPPKEEVKPRNSEDDLPGDFSSGSNDLPF